MKFLYKLLFETAENIAVLLLIQCLNISTDLGFRTARISGFVNTIAVEGQQGDT